jgi:hypothetical protein
MRDKIVRLSGMRQGMGLAALVVSVVAFIQSYTSTSWLAGATTGALSLLVLGITTIVWAIEERARDNKAFAVGFLLLGVAVVAVAVRGLLIYARA